ncbi:(2Fe-2S)-binding protein [Siminovitchia sediminis]|uniref:(2Fe-2S)-binding protein n=1 Tax=Siminovitchia sediminis TaxID=1274353 RepID=A0ABW4KE37_9BACI
MNDLIVCRCEGVRLSDILRAADEGASSMPGMKKRVRVGMGYCQGRVCQAAVRNLLEFRVNHPAKPVLQRAQAPVRPIRLKDIINSKSAE